MDDFTIKTSKINKHNQNLLKNEFDSSVVFFIKNYPLIIENWPIFLMTLYNNYAYDDIRHFL